MSRTVNLRSDTFSLPSQEMYDELRSAELGDDVYGEDPTVRKLEALAAELTGKEAALLVTSGSQGNITALLTHCPQGGEILVGATTDLYNFEVSGMSALGGLMPRPLPDESGWPSAGEVERAIRVDDIHAAPTALICIENTHQRAGGVPIPLVELRTLSEVARDHGLPLHMDGARLFNAAVALGVPPKEITAAVDSVSFCLSKGLSCPAGSMLCGSRDFISRAVRVRKMLGGGMRQSGWIAAPGLVGLRNYERLAEDHRNAWTLAHGLADTPGLTVDLERVKSNIVYVDVSGTNLDAGEFLKRLAPLGVQALQMGPTLVRMVIYRNIEPDDVAYALDACRRVASGESVASAGEISLAHYAG